MKKLKGSINYDFFNKMLTRGKEKGDMVQTAKALIEAIQPLPFYRVPVSYTHLDVYKRQIRG